MTVYLIGFFLSVTLLAWKEKIENKYMAKCMVALGLLIPCLIAGLRAETIGTDVRIYVKQIYEAAYGSSSFGEFYGKSWFAEWRYKYISEFEIGFTALVYIVTKIVGTLSAVLTSIHLLIVIPIYFGLKSFKDSQPVWFGMLVFYFMYFNESLNMMRQWIAMALIIFAFHYLVQKRYKIYAMWIVIAMLFHTSAIVGVGIALIYCFIQPDCILFIKFRNKLHMNKEMKVIIIFVAGGAAICILPVVIKLMHMIGLGGYEGYLTGDFTVLIGQIAVRMPMFALFVFNWKSLKAKNYLAPFYLTMLTLDLVFSQLISINMYAYRIASYFSIYVIFSEPALVYSKNKIANRNVVKIYIVLYLLAYWLYYTVIRGTNETIPYIFR